MREVRVDKHVGWGYVRVGEMSCAKCVIWTGIVNRVRGLMVAGMLHS